MFLTEWYADGVHRAEWFATREEADARVLAANCEWSKVSTAAEVKAACDRYKAEEKKAREAIRTPGGRSPWIKVSFP